MTLALRDGSAPSVGQYIVGHVKLGSAGPRDMTIGEVFARGSDPLGDFVDVAYLDLTRDASQPPKPILRFHTERYHAEQLALHMPVRLT